MTTRKRHWEQVYCTKLPEQVSWTQTVPKTSLDFIHEFSLPKHASIIDIGGGDSRLVDYLLEEGFSDITVLDIAEHALEKAQTRLGEKSNRVRWIVSDITEFKPTRHYDLWHDRATFHFLTTPEQIATYIAIAGCATDHYLVIGTFSENGPNKCSGLSVKQYSENDLQQTLAGNFKKIECVTEDHITPLNKLQNFTFCSFEKIPM
jgi:hypothetical protein